MFLVLRKYPCNDANDFPPVHNFFLFRLIEVCPPSYVFKDYMLGQAKERGAFHSKTCSLGIPILQGNVFGRVCSFLFRE